MSEHLPCCPSGTVEFPASLNDQSQKRTVNSQAAGCWQLDAADSDDEEAFDQSVNDANYQLLWHCKKFHFSSAIACMDGQRCVRLIKDKDRRTAAHYAAMHSDGEETLARLMRHCGNWCLHQADADEITPLHFAARYHSHQSVQKYLNAVKAMPLYFLRDSNGDTCAHWATRHANDDDMIFTMKNNLGEGCLGWRNRTGTTVLQYALQWCSHDVVQDLVKNIDPNSDLFFLADEDNNKAAHFAARSPHDNLLLLVKKVGVRCLQERNSDSATPLHYAMQNCSPKAVKLLLKMLAESAAKMRTIEFNWPSCADKDGNTCLHLAARGGRDEVLKAAVEKAGLECLKLQNRNKSTVLHYMIEHCSAETALDLMQVSRRDLRVRDKDGNTCVHMVARRSDKNLLLPKTLQVAGRWSLGWQNKKKQSILHLAIDACSIEQIDRATPSDIRRADTGGNTLLHSLLQSSRFCTHQEDSAYQRRDSFSSGNHELNDGEAANEILFRMKLLIKRGVDPCAENYLGQNCLHATLLNDCVLSKLLEKCSSEAETKDIFSRLLTSSSGIHAIHSFAGRYQLEIVAEPLAGLSGLSLSDLLQRTVTDDTNKGATCLHFACAAGHVENIRFLLKKNLELWAVTQHGQSCIDFAIEKGNLEIVLQAVADYNEESKQQQQILQAQSNKSLHEVNPIGASSTDDFRKLSSVEDSESGEPNVLISITKLLRLVDPPHRALKMPDRATAQRLLVSIADETLRVKLSVQKVSRKLTDKKILLRAVEMDSPKVYRSALSLGIVTASTEKAFPKFFMETLADKSGPYIRQTFFNRRAFLHRRQMSVHSEMSLIESVAFFDRDEILPDLILTRQFELIPCCISLLIHLAPMVSQLRVQATGKHEQLQQLQSKVTSIVVNALNELFVNANYKERRLLFKYIRGEITDDDGSNPGPKFPYRSVEKKSFGDIKFDSILELVKMAGSNDLFATDFMYSLADEDWNKRCPQCMLPRKLKTSTGCVPGSSSGKCFNAPRTKFWTHSMSFALFLGFFAWYIIEFQGSYWLHGTEAILVAYFLSFAIQELIDFSGKRSIKEYSLGRTSIMLPEYFEDVLNFLDVFALVFLLAGLIMKWIYLANKANLREVYKCQMILSTSFALFCFRAVAILSYSDTIGPIITMLWSLLFNDLLPFLTIIFIIFCSFGVFFFNLLFSFTSNPTAHMESPLYRWENFVQAVTLPFNVLFTNFDQIKFEASMNATRVGKIAHSDGIDYFNSLIMFVFMGLVNIVMLNLLIALFNLRVSRMAGEAIGIWRKTYFDMLQEYQALSPIPPPFSFLWYIFYYFPSLMTCAKHVGPAQQEWWLDEAKYPTDYVDFLKFQAVQFRRARLRLLRDIRWNRNDFDVLKAHTRNQLSDVNLELHESIAELRQQLESVSESRGNSKEQPDATTVRQPTTDQARRWSLDERSRRPVEGQNQLQESLAETRRLLSETDSQNRQMQKKIQDMGAKMDKIVELLESRT